MSGNCNVVEIRYSGKIEAIASFMPNRTFVRMNKNKIILYKSNLDKFPVELFTYNGNLIVKKVILYGYKSKFVANVVNDEADTSWAKQNSDTVWSDEESEWQEETVNNNYSTSIPNGRHGFYILNQSSNGRFINANGSAYLGAYHTHSDGSVFKGAKPRNKQEILYIRLNDKIIATDKNLTKNIRLNLSNIYRNANKKSLMAEKNKIHYSKGKY